MDLLEHRAHSFVCFENIALSRMWGVKEEVFYFEKQRLTLEIVPN